MSDCLTSNWWETSAFAVSCATDDGWEDLDGDLELSLAIEGLLTGNRKRFWDACGHRAWTSKQRCRAQGDWSSRLVFTTQLTAAARLEATKDRKQQERPS